MARDDTAERPAGEPVEPSSPILRTKLFVPPVHPGLIARPRLYDILNEGLNKTLMLICAPAGYGKTTLVSNWLSQGQTASTWLSLDEDDNDPIRFLQYFMAALHPVVPTIRLDLLGMIQDRQPSSLKFLVNVIINEIASQAQPFGLVLDDFHVIHNQAVLDFFAHFLEHAPLQAHIILLSRSDPPLPLARLRARGRLIELRAGQLRFTHPEVASFVNERGGLSLSAGDIYALEERTEGWIAGLQLASVAIQSLVSGSGSGDVHAFVSAFTGSHHYIMDYLVDEVLRLQSEDVRLFMLQSSILERISGALCDRMMEKDGKSPGWGQSMLETIEQMNLFLIPLDGERRWYRYHHLFADVLARRFEQAYPGAIPALHSRAAQWFEQNGDIFDAIRHNLLAGDKAGAARLLDQHGCELLMRGEVINLLHWIEAVEPYSQTCPWIAIQKGWALSLTGHADQAEAPFQAADRLVSALPASDEASIMTGTIAGGRAAGANMSGDSRRAVELARQALDALPFSSDFSCALRGAATSILGDASWMEGNLAEAQHSYDDAVQISRLSGNIHMLIIASTNLADVMAERGQLFQAGRVYAECLQMATSADGQVSPLAEKIYAGLGELCYERNRLQEAADAARHYLEFARRWGSAASQALAYRLLAWLALAGGEKDAAGQIARSFEQLTAESDLSLSQSITVLPELARLWISLGKLDKASDLLKSSGIVMEGIPSAGEITSPQRRWYLVLLRLHLARGAFEEAAALAETLLRQKMDADRPDGDQSPQWISTLILQALAYHGQRDIDRALEAIEKALVLARPVGYVRIFLDEGEPMARLLYQARSHGLAVDYVSELLGALGESYENQAPPVQLLIEPLTERELEVLKLVEGGCSNQEIAARLFISTATAKRHISNIYSKLGVSSRTQALVRSKELKLL